jgi:hypothetical protein
VSLVEHRRVGEQRQEALAISVATAWLKSASAFMIAASASAFALCAAGAALRTTATSSKRFDSSGLHRASRGGMGGAANAVTLDRASRVDG